MLRLIMSKVIYRKYRPQKFTDVIGQEDIVKILVQTIIAKQPSHAYLFCGPRGTGKTTTARIFAAALNCQNFGNDVCGKCHNCVAAAAGKFLDTIEIDAASNRGIGEIRELKEKLCFAPVQGNYKVYIIDEVHMLTKEAFNAILKTLEEPPSETVFILATTEPHKLLPTILSRVVRFDFKLASDKAMLEKLVNITKKEGIAIEIAALERLIKLARGSFRDAESLLEKVIRSATGKDEPMTVESLELILNLVSQEEVNALLDELIGTSSTNGVEVLSSLDSLTQKGFSLSTLVAELVEVGLSKLLDTYASKDRNNLESAPDMKQSQLLYFELLKLLQDWQVNSAIYSDSLTALKIELLRFKQKTLISNSDGLLPSIPVSNDVRRIKHILPVLANMPVEGITTLKVPKIVDELPVALLGKTDEAVKQTTLVDANLLENLVRAVRSKSASLAAVVEKVTIYQIASQVTVIVPSKFHYSRMDKPEIRRQILNELKVLLGDGIQFDLQLRSTTAIPATSLHTPISTNQSKPAGNGNMVEEVFGDMLS